MATKKITPFSYQIEHLPLNMTMEQVIEGIRDGTIKIKLEVPDVDQLTEELQNRVLKTTKVVAGDGMTGGGALSGDVTVALGKPSDITATTDNTVTATSHTHKIILTPTDIGLGNVDNTSDADKPVSTAQQTALDKKVDKVTGKGLSDTNFTQAEKDKLASLESSKYRGYFASEAELVAAFPTGEPGWYADVDAEGEDVRRFIWDMTESKWVEQSGIVPALTPAEVKVLYEENADTNAFTDDEKTKVADSALQSDLEARTVNPETIPAQGDSSIVVSGFSKKENGVRTPLPIPLSENTTQQGIVLRDENGRIQTKDPVADEDAANKKFVQNLISQVGGFYSFIPFSDQDIDEAQATGLGSQALGNDAVAEGVMSFAAARGKASGEFSYAIGGEASGDYSIAVGFNTHVTELGSIALGDHAKTYAEKSISIGSESGVDSGATSSVAIGADSNATKPNQVAFGHDYGTSKQYRILSYVANPEEDTDATPKKWVVDEISRQLSDANAIPSGTYGQFVGYDETTSSPTSFDFSFKNMGWLKADNINVFSGKMIVESSAGLKDIVDFSRNFSKSSYIVMTDANGNVKLNTNSKEILQDDSAAASSQAVKNIVTTHQRLVTQVWANSITSHSFRINQCSVTTLICRAGTTYYPSIPVPNATSDANMGNDENLHSFLHYLVVENGDQATINWGTSATSRIKWSWDVPPDFEPNARYTLGFRWCNLSKNWIASIVSVEVI